MKARKVAQGAEMSPAAREKSIQQITSDRKQRHQNDLTSKQRDNLHR